MRFVRDDWIRVRNSVIALNHAPESNETRLKTERIAQGAEKKVTRPSQVARQLPPADHVDAASPPYPREAVLASRFLGLQLLNELDAIRAPPLALDLEGLELT